MRCALLPPAVRRAGFVLASALTCGSLVAAQPAHLDNWTTARSLHFEVRSDAGPERTEELVRTLEIFRAVFAGFAPELELRSPVPTRIFAFRDAASYAPYKTVADRRGVRILGQFLSHRDGNFMTLNTDPRLLGAFSVVLHEYVHELAHHNFARLPRWFNEGLAEYYSTFAVEGSTAVIGRPVERHLRWLSRSAELGLDEVLAAPRGAGEQNEADKEGRFYAVSWALVHYLLSAGDQRAAQLADFLSRGTDGPDAIEAFGESFDLRLSEMEQQLRRYLSGSEMPAAVVSLANLPGDRAVELRVSRPSELLVGLGHLVARMGRDGEAERHFDLALRHVSDHPDALAGVAWVRARQGRVAEADVLFGEAMELGSRSALTHLLYGRHLVELHRLGGLDGSGAERAALGVAARDAFARAVELDPSFAEAEAMLGYAHLLGGLAVADGIPHLERARAKLPGREDLAFQLLQAYLRADQPRRAEALAEGDIRRFGSAERLAEAREEIERWTLVQSANRALAAGETEAGLTLLDRAISVTTDPGLRERLERKLEGLREGAAAER